MERSEVLLEGRFLDSALRAPLEMTEGGKKKDGHLYLMAIFFSFMQFRD